MSSHGYYLIQLECDRYPACKHYQDFEHTDREAAKKQAVDAGWKLGQDDDMDSEDLCQQCALDSVQET